nr:MAG TPA: hypothetical protein [Caudoviricetes sp.]
MVRRAVVSSANWSFSAGARVFRSTLRMVW